jgi:predicted ATPase
VRLQGLRREGVAQFLREILHGPVSDDLVYRVHRHTSGSPLAVEATVRMLIEERRLEQRGGDFCLVPSAAPLLQGAFDLRAEAERRLSGLGEAEGRAVRAAAVIGEAFWPGALRALGVPNPKEAVASLLKAEIVTRQPMSRFSGYEELTFKQVAVRDAIYGGLPEDERKRLHGLMVPWLEARAERGIVWMAAVAEHLVGAGRLSEAAAHHAEMAKAARAIASWHDAAMHYRRAAELVEDGRRRSEWLAQMTEMLAKIGGDTVRAGDFKVVPRVVPEGL